MRVVRRWPRLPRDVDNPSLGTFKVGLDWAPNNPTCLKMSLVMAGGWTEEL